MTSRLTEDKLNHPNILDESEFTGALARSDASALRAHDKAMREGLILASQEFRRRQDKFFEQRADALDKVEHKEAEIRALQQELRIAEERLAYVCASLSPQYEAELWRNFETEKERRIHE